MFFKRQQKNPMADVPEQVARVVTSSFADTAGGRLTVLFAEAERIAGKAYLIYSSKQEATWGRGERVRELIAQPDTLQEALEVLDEWERAKSAIYPVSKQDTGRNAPHYKDIAKQLGTGLGPNMTSALHSDRIKRVAAVRTARSRLRGPGQG